MSTSHRSYIPRINPNCNVQKLTITPYEAYVLSRVDGHTSASDIGLITGMGDDVFPILLHLFSLGALLEGPDGATSPQPSNSITPPGAPPGKISSLPPVSSQPPAYSQAELEEEVDIDLERRKLILQMFYNLDHSSHYEILGVEPNADVKVIKDAYNELVKIVHPDRYFRKEIGSYRIKLEGIFKQITEAREILTRKQTRKEYDEELARNPKKKRVSSAPFPTSQSVLRPSSSPPSPLDAKQLPVSKFPSVSPSPAATPVPPVVKPMPATATPSHVAVTPVPATVRSTPVSVSSTSTTVAPAQGSELTTDERRRAFAARLSGRWTVRPPTHSSPPSVPPQSSQESAVQARDALKRMAISRQIEQHRGQMDRYIASAQECILQSDPVGAMNAYRLALALDPENEILQGLVQEWSGKAAIGLAGQNLQAGESEASQGRWKEAARYFVKAATGRPDDPDVLGKAAHALVQASGDLHLAAELARKAVSLAGQSATHRIILAEVYAAAGLGLNARRELAEASKIEPNNPRIKVILRGLG